MDSLVSPFFFSFLRSLCVSFKYAFLIFFKRFRLFKQFFSFYIIYTRTIVVIFLFINTTFLTSGNPVIIMILSSHIIFSAWQATDDGWSAQQLQFAITKMRTIIWMEIMNTVITPHHKNWDRTFFCIIPSLYVVFVLGCSRRAFNMHRHQHEQQHPYHFNSSPIILEIWQSFYFKYFLIKFIL